MIVGTDQEGIIREQFKISDQRLIIIKDHASYELIIQKLSDDGNYTNPIVQQKILPCGTSSPILQRILLTSDELFNSTALIDIDINKLRSHALLAMEEIAAMQRIHQTLSHTIDGIMAEIDGQNIQEGFIVPTLEYAFQDAKSFIQKSDHFMMNLREITKVLMDDFDGWKQIITKEKAKETQDFEYISFMEKATNYILFCRGARNAVEHPKSDQYVNVSNFTLLDGYLIEAPAIEIVNKNYNQHKIDLATFMGETIESLSHLYAEWIAQVCARACRPPLGVIKLSKAERRFPDCAYTYTVLGAAGEQANDPLNV